MLFPLAWLYAVAARVRNWCFDRNILRVQHVAVPVISVGNLTTGGTGKTPFVEYIARYLCSKNKCVAVISRGYGRSTKGTHLVTDGKQIRGTAFKAGDESFQIANKLPAVIVVVDEDRVRGAQFAVDQFHPDVIVLDDGFQHRRLYRDMDIVLIDATRNIGEISFLPLGRRRENVSSLRRATLIALTRVDDIVPDWMNGLRDETKAPMVTVNFRPERFRCLDTKEVCETEHMKGKQCVAFCGIGNPESFRKILVQSGLHVVEFVVYPDHHQYTEADFSALRSRLESGIAEMMVTTEKDASRFVDSHRTDHSTLPRCYVLEIETVVTNGKEVLHNHLESIFHKAA